MENLSWLKAVEWQSEIFINLTPHAIVLNDGTVFEPSGFVARVESSFEETASGFYRVNYGEISGFPAFLSLGYPSGGPECDGCYYCDAETSGNCKNWITPDIVWIVSGMVKAAIQSDNIAAPATGHPETIRNDKGHIVSVPGFIR